MVNEAPPRAAAPTWLYGITMLPFGVASGFAGIATPFLLRRAGVSVERIAEIVALCLVPAAYQFFWAPILDLGPRRKHWLILVAILGALCIFGALLVPIPDQLSLFVALAVAGQALTGRVGSGNGALMATTLPDTVRGRAGGYANAGNLGGSALGAGVTMVLVDRMAPSTVGAIAAAMIILPSLAVLFVDEPARPPQRAAELFRGMLSSLWKTLRSRAGITGILICSSPVGTAAAMNLFSGMGPDYGTSERVVTVVNGFAGGLISAAGSLLGGYISDRIPRRWAYLGAGLLTAACAFSMSFFPLSPTTYIFGVGTYLFIAGLCYSAFSALVLEVVGSAGATASTQYTLFSAAGNQAIGYTVLLLGKGATHWGGPAGMLRADALANVVGVAYLIVVMALFSRYAARPSST